MRDLALRSWAEELFNSLIEKECNGFILDFSGREFVSKSFAHEYLKQKQKVSFSIREKNKKPVVKQMFNLASQIPAKREIEPVKPSLIQNL